MLSDFKLNKRANYIVAGTFGCDSMAMIDMLMKAGVKPIVCAVNYHATPDSDEDIKSLTMFCLDHDLVIEKLDCNDLPENEKLQEGGDFKEWARKVRYGFFKEIYVKYKASALFLAHQQDDLIETYLLQKQRKGKVAHYGIARIATVDDMMVVRPLLGFSKDDLRDYNRENHVPYNASTEARLDSTVRTELRASISRMSESERDAIIEEMKIRNNEKTDFAKSAFRASRHGMAGVQNELGIRPLIALPPDIFAETLTRFVQTQDEHVTLDAEKIAEIRSMCLAPKPNMSMKLTESVYLMKEYDILTIGSNIENPPYTYILEKPGKLSTPNFDLDFSMGAEDRRIHDYDYPITIRTALPHDVFTPNGYLQNVRALYSEWEMPVEVRAQWPVFLNKDGKVIYVPRYRRGFTEYHTSILKMHIKGQYR